MYLQDTKFLSHSQKTRRSFLFVVNVFFGFFFRSVSNILCDVKKTLSSTALYYNRTRS
ncbi:unnamed protein product [Tenebrio molitor]|nr:unnamed protein product [Tenebrio molitor]